MASQREHQAQMEKYRALEQENVDYKKKFDDQWKDYCQLKYKIAVRLHPR